MMGACKCARGGGAGVCCGGSWLKLETNKKHDKKVKKTWKFKIYSLGQFCDVFIDKRNKPQKLVQKMLQKPLWFESVEFDGNRWRVTLPSSGALLQERIKRVVRQHQAHKICHIRLRRWATHDS